MRVFRQGSIKGIALGIRTFGAAPGLAVEEIPEFGDASFPTDEWGIMLPFASLGLWFLSFVIIYRCPLTSLAGIYETFSWSLSFFFAIHEEFFQVERDFCNCLILFIYCLSQAGDLKHGLCDQKRQERLWHQEPAFQAHDLNTGVLCTQIQKETLRQACQSAESTIHTVMQISQSSNLYEEQRKKRSLKPH